MSQVCVHDVVIVGGGGAGLRAAIAIAQESPELSVATISKVYPMRSHTVAAEGGAAAVIKANDSYEAHIHDTVSGADWLADQDAVEYFVHDAPKQLIQLEHWGCPWSRDSDGSVAVRPFGGMANERTWFAADKTGFHLLHTLFQTSLKYDNITRYDEHYATNLIMEDGRCIGATAIELRTGMMRAIAGRSVIMCTGGAGRVFPFTTNGAIKNGDGMAMAYRAGVPLKDMEFVQYHPTGLPGTGILITEAARGEGGILVNRHGERYLKDYNLGEPVELDDPRHPQKRTMELGPRDKLSQVFMKERAKGNTIETERGHIMHLDIRHLGEKTIDRKLPFVRELARNYVGIDPVYEPIPVCPVIHYCMGGIATDINTATSLPGLYAAGECACVSINGANRLGSNSLTEILVFGAVAGAQAAQFAMQQSAPNEAFMAEQAEAEQARLRTEYFDKTNGAERIATLRSEMYDAMEKGAGIFRTHDELQNTCQVLADLRTRARSIALADRTNSFNTELTTALELQNMLQIAQALAHSAIERCESRGSHQRTDFPQRDDSQFLKHSLAYYQGADAPRIDYHNVVITRWPPAERVYGVQAPDTKT